MTEEQRQYIKRKSNTRFHPHNAYMNFHDILAKYRPQSFSEHDKGTRFERLMKAWLLTAPQCQNVIKDVWMWSEFPFRKNLAV